MTSISASNDPNIGIIIAKRIQIKHLIGKGAMGSVYYAEDIAQKEKSFAIKFLQTLVDENLRRRFAREASIGAQLGKKSPHIVQVMAYGIHEEKIPFYVMELVRGSSLNNIVQEQPLPLARFFPICRQICLGLQAAHQGVEIKGKIYPVIHRDIKPANILIKTDPKGDLVKILDFGIAKLLGEQAKLTGTYDFLGTMIYSSPEQMEGRELDNRSDIYSLGIVMYEMLTGKLPWEEDATSSNSYGAWYKFHHFQAPRSFKDANPNLKFPAELEQVVMKCLAKEPSDRPQTIDEVLKALEPIETRFKSSRIEPTSTARQKPASSPSSSEQVRTDTDSACWQASWPENKPIAEIVFPYPIRTSKETLAALWVMLPRQQIQKIQQDVATPDNHNFLNSMSPHPLLLWLTVLYSQHHEPRWLPCFLDLKTQQGQAITRLLAATGFYAVLFFALEEPTRVAHVMKFAIGREKCESLKGWSEEAQRLSSSAPPEESKKLLKAELEKVKPKMLLKLAAQL